MVNSLESLIVFTDLTKILMVLLQLLALRRSLVLNSWYSALDFPKITCHSKTMGGTVVFPPCFFFSYLFQLWQTTLFVMSTRFLHGFSCMFNIIGLFLIYFFEFLIYYIALYEQQAGAFSFVCKCSS